jgi:hypothetical protein
MERTREDATEAIRAGRQGRDSEAAFDGEGAISKLCDEVGLQPTVFYRWQKEFFENGAAAFEQKARPNPRRTKSITLEVGIRGCTWPRLWGHSTISPVSVKRTEAGKHHGVSGELPIRHSKTHDERNKRSLPES